MSIEELVANAHCCVSREVTAEEHSTSEMVGHLR